MSGLIEGLIIVAATLLGGTAISWMGWVSLTLIAILRGITSNTEAIEDHERRLTDNEF